MAIQNRGKPIHHVVFSPQHEYICIQRSDTEIEFTVVSKLRTFIKTVRKPKDSRILGIHWTFRSNMIVVTTHTVELYQVEESGQLKLLKYYNVDVNWYKYAARNKILCIATGATSSNLWNFVFKEDVVFRIPRFDVHIPVQPEHLVVSQVYSNVYILIVDPQASLVRMYTVTKDAVKPSLSLNLAAKARVAVNVVDNLVAVHNLDAKVTFLFDIQWSDPTYPVAGPLPMTETGQKIGADLYGPQSVFCVPNVIINESLGVFWTLDLRVEDIVKAISTDVLSTLKFLVRRAKSKQIILDHMRKIILSQSSLGVVAQCFDVLNAIVGHLPANVQKQLISMSPQRVSSSSSSSSSQKADQKEDEAFVARRTTRGHMIVDQRDVYADVFSAVMENEKAPPDRYLVSVIVEYTRSLTAHKIELEHFLFEMLIGLLVKNKWFSQLQMLLQYHVVDDALPVALQLLAIPREDCPAAHQLALDMLQRLKKHDVIVDVLLGRGDVLAALRFALESKNTNVPLDPKRFLDASLSERHVFFSVFRFFEEKGFATPPDYVQKFSKEFAIGKEK